MEYTVEMILRSPSGYCMPFEETEEDVTFSLGYGEQTHPVTGEKFFHHGIDFPVSHRLLAALASGTVTAIGSDRTHGICQTIRYGKYEVTYGHLSNVYAGFGQPVQAGKPVALSGRLLHIEVKFDGEELNPLEFLTMLYGNLKAVSVSESRMQEGMEAPGFRTRYDKDRQEREALEPVLSQNITQSQMPINNQLITIIIKSKYYRISLAISIFGCIFGCRISNTPSHEHQTKHHFCT